MNHKKQSILTTMALALVLALAAGSVPAADAGGEAMASLSVLGAEVAWVSNGEVERFALRVAGPETDLEERFEGGVSPVFSLFDERGDARPDGVYNWELREEAPPVNNRVRDPKNGRDLEMHDRNERVEFAGGFQWGSFSIKDGAVVDASLVEVQKPRPVKD